MYRVCIDDFALKKRYSYGTVMVDWDTHRIIDMIPSRESTEVSVWLSTYPNILMISRDGASGYASAGAKAHPDAVQVTDRFHLLKNLAEVVDRYIKNKFPSRVGIESHTEYSKQMQALYDTANRTQRIRYAHSKRKEGLTVQEIAYLLHAGVRTVENYLSIPEDQIPKDKDTVRERQYNETIKRKENEIKHVRQLFDEGMTVTEIACATHHSSKTIRNYLNPDFSPHNGHYDLKRRGKLTPYEQDIISMRSNGQTYTEIYEFIKSKGYIGSVAAIRMFMQKERAHAKRLGLHGGKDYIHRITLSQLVYRNLEDVKLITQDQYEALLKQYPELAALYGILRDLHRIVFSKKAEDLEHWIEQASHLDAVPELKSFVDGLKHDIFAIKNAIMFDYNNGLAEGSVTKIKLIKRIMYGRNSFALLKAKVLMHELLYANSN